MSNVLVTGGAGFIGANFIHYWHTHHPDDFITNLDALTYAGNLHSLETITSNYRFLHGTITDSECVDEAMKGIDTVVHFAAESHVDRSIQDPGPFVSTNVFGTVTLLKAALKHSIKRFHHISTDEVFGALPLNSESKFTLSTPYNPRSPYAASKASSDHFVRAYGTTYGLPFTISNCSNNYGPYHFPEKLIPLAITNIMEKKKVPIYGDGKYVRDWLYVEDHCRAIEAILEKGELGKTYLVGGMHEEVNNETLIKEIARLMDVSFQDIAQYTKDRPGHDRRYAIDWSATQNKLGWTPQETLESGLKKTIHWYEHNESWWRNVKNGSYREYYQQQYEQ